VLYVSMCLFNFLRKMEDNTQLMLFEKKQIRQTEHNGETYFSVIDVIEILSESPSPSHYWSMLKKREPQLVTICYKLKMLAVDGKNRPTDCANREGVLRIIQSVPSPKAEPFKLWLAQVGTEKIEELENPELSYEHLRELYRAKGYDDKWIQTRLKSIEIRNELTDEWKKRGVTEGGEYAILTAEISKETFGITPKEHADLKGLEKQNLRDHMTNLELVFTMLGEEVTRSAAENDDAQGFHENLDAAKKGGRVAGNARRNAEKVTGVKVVSGQNFLNLGKEKKEELPPESFEK
jgi:DNA-damage-inducible protein D